MEEGWCRGIFDGSLMHEELILDVVDIFQGSSTEFICRIEVEAGSYKQVWKVFRGNVAGPR